MRSAPFDSLKTVLRVFAKAIILLIIVDLLFLAIQIDPAAALMRLNTWELVGHGRNRLIYPSDFQNGQLPIEALLAAHEVAFTPKTLDEYRVFVLGSSGILGYGLPDADTFSAQLNARHLTIDGKRLVAYNLAYPSPHVARDAIILDAAMTYKPDLIIWFCTGAALNNAPAENENNAFFDLNRERLKRLTDKFGLQHWFETWMPSLSPLDTMIAIHHREAVATWLSSLLYPFLEPDLEITNKRIGNEPIPAKARYFTGHSGFTPIPNETWNFLEVGQNVAEQGGAQLLLVDEPTVIGTGPNSDINLSKTYERAFYESFRATMTTYTQQHHIWYADLWDAIPAANFTDTSLHIDKAGYRLLADRIVGILEATLHP